MKTMAYSPEDPASPPPPVGHQISAAAFLGDAMRLMAYVQAGGAVAAIWRGPRMDPDDQLAKLRSVFIAHQANEIPRLLISVAATLRAKLDDGSWRAPEACVGWVAPGTLADPGRHEALSIREACNKIMHAREVTPAPQTDNGGLQFIGALLTMTGERGEQQWCAELNLQAFCIAVANIDFYARGGKPCQY